MGPLAPRFALLSALWFGCSTSAAPMPPGSPSGVAPEAPVLGELAYATGHCQRTERLLFECAVDSGKFISLCISADFPKPGSELQYRFGPKESPGLRFPEDPTLWRGAFRWQRVNYVRSAAYEVQFEQDGHTYTVFDQDTLGTEQDNGSGVRVEKGGKALATLLCAGDRKLAIADLEGVLTAQ